MTTLPAPTLTVENLPVAHLREALERVGVGLAALHVSEREVRETALEVLFPAGADDLYRYERHLAECGGSHARALAEWTSEMEPAE